MYIDGHKIAFLEQGVGSPVILIHGIPTNSLMWRDIIPKLAAKHQKHSDSDLEHSNHGKNPSN
jgi:pimeloyl-ACP methyl ester carboxylesterase